MIGLQLLGYEWYCCVVGVWYVGQLDVGVVVVFGDDWL